MFLRGCTKYVLIIEFWSNEKEILFKVDLEWNKKKGKID